MEAELAKVMSTGLLLYRTSPHVSADAFRRLSKFGKAMMMERMRTLSAADRKYRDDEREKERGRMRVMAPGVASAISALRGVEEETRKRNLMRQVEMSDREILRQIRAFEAEEEAERRRTAARAASEEREAAGVARSRSGSPVRAPAVGGAGTAEPEKPVLPVADLPEEVQKRIREMVGPDDRFNLARTFTSGKAAFRARANAILLGLAAFAEDGPDGKVYVRAPTGYQGQARDVANELPVLNDLVGRTSPYSSRKFVDSFLIAEPTREQLEMLSKGLKYTEFFFTRGRAGITGPVSIKVEWRVKSNDLNLKTKAGRAELAARKAEDTATALDYLKRAARPDFMAYLDTLEGRRNAKIAETKAVAKAVFSIPATEAKAEYVSPDDFEDVYLAFYGDADRAKAAAAALRRRIPGRRAKFFGRKNLNIMPE